MGNLLIMAKKQFKRNEVRRMEKSDERVVVDVHMKNKDEARKYQEAIRETELNLLEFINTTIKINKTKNNPEMVSALAGLLKVVKQTF